MISGSTNNSKACYSHSGKLKTAYNTSDEAINAAKYVNSKDKLSPNKLVAYKCMCCFKYHLTSKPKRIR